MAGWSAVCGCCLRRVGGRASMVRHGARTVEHGAARRGNVAGMPTTMLTGESQWNPRTRQRVPIDIDPEVRRALRDLLFEDYMRGVGYSEFIRRAVAVARAERSPSLERDGYEFAAIGSPPLPDFDESVPVAHSYSTGPRGGATEDVLYLHGLDGRIVAVGSVEKVRGLLRAAEGRDS